MNPEPRYQLIVDDDDIVRYVRAVSGRISDPRRNAEDRNSARLVIHVLGLFAGSFAGIGCLRLYLWHTYFSGVLTPLVLMVTIWLFVIATKALPRG